MHTLQGDSCFADIPYELNKELKDALNEKDNWKVLAYTMRDLLSNGTTTIISSTDIQRMMLQVHPSSELMKILFQLNSTVNDVQYLLKKSGLNNVADILITNDEVEFVEPTENQDVAIQLGNQYEMKVDVDGSPTPKLHWYHNDMLLPEQNENKLIIGQFCKGDEGVYQCQAVQNIQGRQEVQWSPTFSLKAKPSRPAIAHGKDLTDLTLMAKEELILKFEVLAEPPPVFTWFKSGKIIQKGYYNTYKVVDVGVTDAGMYFCVAENSEGNCRSTEINVMVIQPCSAPDVPEFVRTPESYLSYALKDTADLYFEVRCRHRVDFACFINEKSLNDTDSMGTSAASRRDGNFIHIYTLHYVVNEEDWCHGNQEPILVRLEAQSQGHCVVSSVRIKVKGAPLQRLSARNKWALLIANDTYDLLGSHLETPAQDMKGFASTLTSLGFRCMTCCNVAKPEFKSILKLFSSYCQKGDYVVFYYAGHGFHCRGTDYMIPLNVRMTGNGRNEIEIQSCISTTEVINRFQESDPALIFYVHDTCRGTYLVRDYQQEPIRREARGNLCQLNATSESYDTYEECESGSLLMQKLKDLVTEKILVTELCNNVLKAFRNFVGGHLHGPQVPQFVNDLQYDCSLTDPSTPIKQDYNGVLKKWEARSNAGGIKEQKVRIGNIVMLVKIKCEQEGYPKIISNSIKVVVTITFLPSNVLTAAKEGLEVTLTPNTSDKEVCATVSETPIRCPIQNLQAVDSDLCVSLSFKKDDDVVECSFNLGTPSLCNIMNSENEL